MRVKKCLYKDRDGSFYDFLSMSKEELLNVIFGRKKLSRAKVVELALKLNRSLNEYITPAGYMPVKFKKIVSISLCKNINQFTNVEINQLMNVIEDIVK